MAAERCVQLFLQRFKRRLRILPEHVDLGVVGDRLQRDMRRALIDEAVADVVVRRPVGLDFAGDFLLLSAAFGAVAEQVEGVLRRHEAGARECQGDAGSVNGDPAPSPLFRNGGGGAGAAGGVEHEVAGIGGHHQAALNHFGQCLYYVDTVRAEAADLCIRPDV